MSAADPTGPLLIREVRTGFPFRYNSFEIHSTGELEQA